jgi:putative oxidoreductase
LNRLEALSPHVHWGMRLSVAATYLWHGSHKFPPVELLENIGIPIPLGYVIAVTEIAVAVALLVGPFTKDIVTRIGGILVVTNMIGAIALVHSGAWDYRTGGMEFQVLLLAVGAYFLVKGNEA